MRKIAFAFAAFVLLVAAQAKADPTVSIGTNVVTAPDLSATFSGLPLYYPINGYTEDGITFSFNESLGHADAYVVNSSWGCCGTYVTDQGFSGNAAYFLSDGTIPYEPVGISSSNGADFSALQFQIGSGYGGPIYAYWEMLDNGIEVGSGSFGIASNPETGIAPATEVAFSGASFDELLIGTYSQPISSFAFQGNDGNAVEIADVAADLQENSAVPAPGALALFGLGLIGLGAARFRRRSFHPAA